VSKNLAVSRALAETIPAKCDVIANPYREDIFVEDSANVRDRDLVFVGRLVSDKGCAVLLEAVAMLGASGLRPTLTIVGSGPEFEALRVQSTANGLDSQIVFAGQKTGAELAAVLNQHRILVVPSLWKEPFGIVALEGIACGCVVVGSEGGGLPEAIGSCGLTFPNGDQRALAELLSLLVNAPEKTTELKKSAERHLACHKRQNVVKTYLKQMSALV